MAEWIWAHPFSTLHPPSAERCFRHWPGSNSPSLDGSSLLLPV